MYKQIILALVLVSVLGNTYFERDNWTFEQYQSHFSKVYDSEVESTMRRQLFEESMILLRKQNSDETQSWKAGVNFFSDMTELEKQAYYKGMDKSLSRPLSASLGASRFLEDSVKTQSNPTSLDYRSQGVISPVKNQGSCGSCWAFATTETVESFGALSSGGSLKILAPQQLVDCAPNPNDCGGTGGCEGSIAELALDYLKGCGGQCAESAYGYTGRDGSCKFSTSSTPPQVSVTGYGQVTANNEQDFEDALVNIGPLAINVWASTWSSYSSGIFTGCPYSSNIDVNHVVQAVGYGVSGSSKYWIVRNSWGTSWGESGYIRLAREDKMTCGKDSTPQDGIRCSGYTKVDEVCGQCGVYYDPVYATGAKVIG